jgi:L-ascorbate metabolism protein UlaG (beta-lactamase superfamily)
MLDNVHWLGHAAVKITGEKILYIDPYQISGGEKADIILITHDHFDHLSQEDIGKVAGEDTVIVVPRSSKKPGIGQIKTIESGKTLTLEGGVEVAAVPAYNLDKAFHKRKMGYVGYVIKMGGITYYHAGDTDHIPEMDAVEADVVFVPVGGTYTMNAEEAAEAVNRIRPKVAVPMHWGTVVGSHRDARRFQELCEGEVRIMEPEN